MLIIERDFSDVSKEEFKVRAKEQGWRGGTKAGRLTLKQANLATEHYFGGHRMGTKRKCPFCNSAVQS